MKDIVKNIEAILFAVGRSVSVEELMAALDVDKSVVEEALKLLKEKYNTETSGICLVKVKDNFQFVTNNFCYNVVATFVESNKKENLTTSAMEVLSIIAYNPNITKSEIENIRGANSDSQVAKLIEYGLIEETGRLKVAGRPAVFAVTEEFLRTMGINCVEDLPDYEKVKSRDVKLEELQEDKEAQDAT